jgi:prevent-host-death family protein
MTTRPDHGCSCDPAWPSLAVHTEAGDIAVQPTATPGALACLYQAYCTGCGAAYPGPFRAQPAAQGRVGKPVHVPGPRKSKEPWTQPPGVPFSRTPESIGFHRRRKTAPDEMSVGELRANLAAVINAAGTRDQVTFVTSSGRRVAAVISAATAKQAGSRKEEPT